MIKTIFDLDAYKVGHMSQYPKDTNYIYSVLQLRSDKYFDKTVIVGLQYFIKKYLCQKITKKDVCELIEELKLMGIYHKDTEDKLMSLAELGYLPIEVKAIEEGTIVRIPNAICTVQNTEPGFHWVVGMVETLLLKWWSALATSACSLSYRTLADKYFCETGSDMSKVDFAVHDFGSRGCMTPEGAAVTGMAHALHFKGSDTIATIPLLRKYYDAEGPVIMSVPASEHAVMCSWGRENEIDAFKNMLETYPTGIVSIVSDTYNWYNVMDNFTVELKDMIEARDGKTVFRPDSGDPLEILFGTVTDSIDYEDFDKYDAKQLGGLRALDKVFGHTVNKKGYKVLNQKVGIIYGDGMYLERYKKALDIMKHFGYAAENLVIGVGGILRNHTRDTIGAAFKATCIKRDGQEWMPICKDPITDQGKKSYKGFVGVFENEEHCLETRAIKANDEIDYENKLQTVFKNGKVVNDLCWTEVHINLCESMIIETIATERMA